MITPVMSVDALTDIANAFAERAAQLIAAAPNFRFLSEVDAAITYIKSFKAHMEIIETMGAGNLQERATELKEEATATEARLWQAAKIPNPRSMWGKKFTLLKRLSGGFLPADKIEQFNELLGKYSGLAGEFARNIKDSHKHLTIPAGKWEKWGLPAEFTQKRQDGEGNLVLKTDFETYEQFMTFCPDNDVLREFYFLRTNLGWPANEAVITSARTIAEQIADLLGFQTSADWQLAKTSKKNGKSLAAFLAKAEKALAKSSQAQMAQLTGLLGTQPEHWHMFAMEKTFSAQQGFDVTNAVQYLGWDNIKKALLTVSESFFELTFEETTCTLWADNLTMLNVFRKGSLVGQIILDPFSRDDKFEEFACFAMYDGDTPVAVIGGSWQKEGNLPDNAKTGYHEWGHALAHILNGAKFKSIEALGDMVEVPSTTLEKLVTHPQAIACYINQDGEQMPEAVAQKYAETMDGKKAIFWHTQLFLAQLLFAYYKESETAPLDVFVELRQKLHPFPYHSGMIAIGTMSHIVLEGYGAAYFAYVISVVVAAQIAAAGNAAGWDDEFNRRFLEVYTDNTLMDIEEVLQQTVAAKLDMKPFMAAIA